MPWDVEFTDEFGKWWEPLTEQQQDDVAPSVGLLAELVRLWDFRIAPKSLLLNTPECANSAR
jgi:hypothetical protein